MIVIVDYGVGNLRSIQNMLARGGFEATIARDQQTVTRATKLILPGIGRFDYGMESLRERGLVGVLNERVVGAQVPVLGICLGAQLLGRGSAEASGAGRNDGVGGSAGRAAGLGWIPMDVVAFDRERLVNGEKVPHMGWTDTTPVRRPVHAAGGDLFAGIEDPRFYYVHSYHFACDDERDVLCTARHGYEFASGVRRGHIVGVQFHPEKSHRFGQQFLANFAALGADAAEAAPAATVAAAVNA
jgi:glutamine amidotransferase